MDSVRVTVVCWHDTIPGFAAREAFLLLYLVFICSLALLTLLLHVSNSISRYILIVCAFAIALI